MLANNAQLVSASSVAVQDQCSYTSENLNYEVPHSLSINEIAEITHDYVQEAKNAITAGFDGIEIHGANGQ